MQNAYAVSFIKMLGLDKREYIISLDTAQALAHALTTLQDPGDKIVITTPVDTIIIKLNEKHGQATHDVKHSLKYAVTRANN